MACDSKCQLNLNYSGCSLSLAGECGLHWSPLSSADGGLWGGGGGLSWFCGATSSVLWWSQCETSGGNCSAYMWLIRRGFSFSVIISVADRTAALSNRCPSVSCSSERHSDTLGGLMENNMDRRVSTGYISVSAKTVQHSVICMHRNALKNPSPKIL